MKRYLLSASGYGERKIILWDASMPKIHHPKHFPHMLYWTTAGLIKKILLRNMIPPRNFWLAENEMDFLEEGFKIVMWPGELDSSESVDTDSDDDDDSSSYNNNRVKGSTLNADLKFGYDGNSSRKNNLEDKISPEDNRLKIERRKSLKLEKKFFGEDDVREIDGIVLNVTMADMTGTKYSQVLEYITGGVLTISLKVSFSFIKLYFILFPSACYSSYSSIFVIRTFFFMRLI